MTTLQTILVCVLLTIWLCFSVLTLITAIQSFIYDRKREKRELAQAERDKEYHAKRMESLMNKLVSSPWAVEQSAALLG